MVHGIFCVYDSKARAYLPPFFLHTVEMAQRAFADCANDQGHAFCRNSGDYTLYQVGEFDDLVGVVKARGPHLNLGLATAYVRSGGFAGHRPALIDVTQGGMSHGKDAQGR